MTALTIRHMAPYDWEDVREIYQQGIATNRATFQLEAPVSYEEWDSTHLEPCRYVAEERGRVIGWAALSSISSRSVYSGVAELSIYIAPSSQRRGTGFALLCELCRSAGQHNFWTLQANIFEENIASIRLHEKCHFRMVGYRERIGKDSYGVWRNTVLMEKRFPMP